MDIDRISTLRYSDIFLAMYSDGGATCLHKGECAFIRKDFGVRLTKKAFREEQFKAIFLMFTTKFLRSFYSGLDKRNSVSSALT